MSLDKLSYSRIRDQLVGRNKITADKTIELSGVGRTIVLVTFDII